MKTNCNKCKNEVITLKFSEEQKLDLYILMQNDLKLFAEKKIIDEFNVDKNEAKIIIQHVNNRNGRCAACEFEKLNGEYIECPNCGAFNYNLNEPVFNLEFCSHLEWSLDFKNIENENIKYYAKSFWCDGISHLPEDSKSLLYHNIEKKRQIITKAWIGYNGNEIYEMKIKFGKKAIENYKNNKSLIECIPGNNENPNWIQLFMEDKKIEIQLK
ncbi:hypothetical protein [Chryseobacterium sp. WLY505]|uniref:hypothetical protein n=1 Tax=Chryseobacterium sp. WLY505 TaxID=3068892 RepID=UPI0027967D43|nr:hypothetical protein [Chryseobacterium sp. WLY505]MDQ1855632.1 hypothetical protein [Chryseobacterium sp. WLY505]